jgi:hypothetical protein
LIHIGIVYDTKKLAKFTASVSLVPNAKYPHAEREFGWQFVFPSHALSRDPRSGRIARHHVDESVLQRAVKAARYRAAILIMATERDRRPSWTNRST